MERNYLKRSATIYSKPASTNYNIPSMKMRILLSLFLAILAFNSKVLAQDNRVDTLSFSMKSSLLVIEGAINGNKALFAFDTGAYAGVLNSKQVAANNIKNNGKKNVRDSNNENKRMGRGKIGTISIGSFAFENIESVIYDMPFLLCNDFYLLGGDVINRLNWKFDFINNLAFISKTPFVPSNDMKVLPVQFINNRHFTDLQVDGKMVRFLVDFGFSGVLDVPTSEINFAKIQNQKAKELMLLQSQTISMGLGSMSIGEQMNTYFADSISLGITTFKNIKVNVKDKTDKKIGIRFFRDNLSSIILNNTDKEYWLQQLEKPLKSDLGLDLDFFLIDGKLKIVGKSLSDNSSGKTLNVGDEIKAVNGKTAASFADVCSFINWRQEQAGNKDLTIETLKGEKINILKAKF
ncbi:MAG: aspartyl protease family protein [Bacteroidota bacterium]